MGIRNPGLGARGWGPQRHRDLLVSCSETFRDPDPESRPPGRGPGPRPAIAHKFFQPPAPPCSLLIV